MPTPPLRCALLAAALTFPLPSTASAAPADHAASPPPNLVLILADDMGDGDPGFQGGTAALTPHLDRLASESLRFTHGYANAPVCAPTRAALLSGMASPRTGVYTVGRGGGGGRAGRANEQAVETPENVESLDPAVVTLAEALGRAGYATGHVGKWHLGDPEGPDGPAASGFDFTVGAARGGGLRSHFAPWPVTGLQDAPAGTPITDRLTDEAIGFVRSHTDAPFFLFVSHYAPHTPIEADAAHLERVRARAPGLDEDQTAYAALLETLDDSVGELLDAIDEAGLADNTVVVFASDNGGHRRYADNGGLAGAKGSLLEGGIRVPLTVRWPGVVEPGRTDDTPVQLFDLYPTFLELARAELPDQPVDGLSWVPLLRDAAPLADRSLVWFRPVYATSPRGRVRAGPEAAIRRGPWKMHLDLETGDTTLHQLVDDPTERVDRLDDEAATAADLTAAFQAWEKETGAPRVGAAP